jgi:Phage T7 tail fibre protein
LAATFNLYSGDGATRAFGLTFPYLDRSHVRVYVNEAETAAFTWLTSATVQMAVAPAVSAVVRVARVTPANIIPVDFTDGSILSEAELDLVTRYSAYLSEESRDFSEAALRENHLGALDARGLRIINVAPSVAPTDAITKGEVSTIAAGLQSSINSIAGSETASGQHAASALASLNEFKGRSYGALPVDPIVDPLGNPPTVGDEYFNSTSNLLKRFNGAAWQGSDINTANLAAPSGASSVGLPALGSSDVAETVQDALQRKAYEVRLLGHSATTLPTPKYSVLSTTPDGNGNHAFPSVARYNGVDYVFYRSGAQHTGNDGTIKVHQVSVDTGVLLSTTTVLDLAYDSRDPCVLTDDYGRVVLVGGKMKIVLFHAGTPSVSVYELDPANVAAGLVGRVDLPATVAAAKTDVKPLAGGGYGFTAYTADSLQCYWVTTPDWVTFTLELIGPGNECAWGQQADGTVVVIARQEVAPYCAKLYKKPVAGAWTLHSTLPLRLAAPTLRKTATPMVSDTVQDVTGKHGGWLLLAKDRRESPSMNGLDVGAMRLVALVSRNNYGRDINDFAICQDIMGTVHTSLKLDPTGDSFYASAVTSEFGSAVTVYSHMQINADVFQPYGSYVIKIIRLLARFVPGVGLVTQPPRRAPENLVLNGNMVSGKHWQVGQNTTRANGRITVANFSGSPSTYSVLQLKAGQQLRIFARARRVSGDGDSIARHLSVELVRVTGSVVIGTLYQVGTLARLGTDFHILRSQPYDIPADGAYMLQVKGTNVASVSELDWLYLGEAEDLLEYAPANDNDLSSVQTASFAGTTGGTPVLTSTYSAAFWDLFGFTKEATGRPFPFESIQEAQESLRILSMSDATGGAMTLRSLVVNAGYTVTLITERASWQAGAAVGSPLTARIECRYKAE